LSFYIAFSEIRGREILLCDNFSERERQKTKEGAGKRGGAESHKQLFIMGRLVAVKE